MKKSPFLLGVLLVFGFAAAANAGLMGTYYNHSQTHPDMQIYTGGTGMVESTLTGAAPTAKASATFNQFDWWNPGYRVMERVDSDTDLKTNFSSAWFPVDTGLTGDPYHFAVHWEGQFYVDEDKSYTYSMGSDDDSWLFIDNQLLLDLGGVHGMSYGNYTVNLTQGWHDIDIFFAERHTSQSGFQLNFFSDIEPPPSIPEPATMLLFATGIAGLAAIGRKKLSR